MNKIGFDFGTTNSAISFYNEESKGLENFQLDASSNDYIPTVVAYRDGETYIGDTAKNSSTKKSFDTYEHFKLRLGSDFDRKIEGKSKSAIEVTSDYISEILEKYKMGQEIENIDGIVMTVPETWFREASNRTARENIEDIYKKLGYADVFQLESEPVAAAGYFCWAYKQKNSNAVYTGFITVIDFGGGTLDVTLCKVEPGGSIKILERCGYGEYNQTNGCAGVAFDEAVTERLIKDNNLGYKKGDKDFIKLRNDFEKDKINFTESITNNLKVYFDDPMIVEGVSIFETGDDEVEVTCEVLAECFEKVNKPRLEESLSQMKNFFKAHNVDSSNQNNFKVLMVGGFSNFYCVEETVRNFFGSKAGLVDKRFDTEMNLKNRSMAISRGAALIAQKIVKVEHVCTHNIGYIVYKPDENYQWYPVDINVIQKGRKITEVHDAVFAENNIEVSSDKGVLTIFMDDGREDGKGKVIAALDKNVRELFPNFGKPNNVYNIGFSVDKNLIPTVHIRDKSGAVNKHSLNRLLERISIRERD